MNLNAIAPTIDNLLKGNLLGTLGSALQILGQPEDASKQDIEEALKNATPEQIAKIKELDNQLQDIYFRDRQSAREMNIQTKSRLVPVLALTIVIGSLSLLSWLYFIDVPSGNQNILYMGLGMILNEACGVFKFYFGSSKGSSDKTDILSKIAGIK